MTGYQGIFRVYEYFQGATFELLLFVAFILLLSSFVKIVTVLGLLRAGLGLGTFPAAFVTGGLAIALSLVTMYPTIEAANSAIELKARELGNPQSLEQRGVVVDAGLTEWKKFLVRNADEKEITTFFELQSELQQSEGRAVNAAKNTLGVLASAFLITELKEAFATGLTIFLPLLIIDLVIAQILVALGLVQLSPLLVALPFKLILFVMVDGWALITANLVRSYI